MKRLLAPTLAALALSSSSLANGNWPHWRGPTRDGISTETGLPVTWSTTENVTWRATLAGLGTSSPIVWGDRVIVTSQVGATPLAGGGGHPQLARDDRGLSAQEAPIGGRLPITLPGMAGMPGFAAGAGLDRSGLERRERRGAKPLD